MSSRLFFHMKGLSLPHACVFTLTPSCHRLWCQTHNLKPICAYSRSTVLTDDSPNESFYGASSQKTLLLTTPLHLSQHCLQDHGRAPGIVTNPL